MSSEVASSIRDLPTAVTLNDVWRLPCPDCADVRMIGDAWPEKPPPDPKPTDGLLAMAWSRLAASARSCLALAGSFETRNCFFFSFRALGFLQVQKRKLVAGGRSSRGIKRSGEEWRGEEWRVEFVW